MSSTNTSDELLGYDELERCTFQTLAIVYQQSQPQRTQPSRWIYYWYQKIHVMWFRKVGYDWPKIISSFKKMGVRTTKSQLETLYGRATREVRTLFRCFEECNLTCTQVNALRVAMQAVANNSAASMEQLTSELAEEEGPDCFWVQVSQRMGSYGARQSWLPSQVRFAWWHGVMSLEGDLVSDVLQQYFEQGQNDMH
jgi:hypothetical protein